MRVLPTPEGQVTTARAVNATGTIVGSASIRDGSVQACLWSLGKAHALGRLGSGRFSCAYDINDHDLVVGAAELAPNGRLHAFQWHGSGMEDLGVLPDGTASAARAVNNNGDIVGWCMTPAKGYRATLWSKGRLVDLGGLGRDPAAAWSINDSHQIVGTSATRQGKMHATLWESGCAYDLNTALPEHSGWMLRCASGINASGQIVGMGYHDARPHAYLLSPLAPDSESGQDRMAFALTDTHGNRRTLTDYRGRTVALFFFCGCDRCRQCAKTWSDIQRSGVFATTQDGRSLPTADTPMTLVIFSGDAQEAMEFERENGLDSNQTVLLPDVTLSVAVKYHSDTCPRVFVIGPTGATRYTNDHSDDAPLTADAAVIASRAVSAVRGDTTSAAPDHGNRKP